MCHQRWDFIDKKAERGPSEGPVTAVRAAETAAGRCQDGSSLGCD